MIASLKGQIEYWDTDSVVLAVNGVGYRVFTIPGVLENLKKGEEITLLTHLHLREDEMSLYGFLTPKELSFFELLIKAPGIGPKGAIGAMSVAAVDTLIKAISSGDTSLLTKVAGIGGKTAERIVVELKSRLEKEHPELTGQDSTVQADVVSALMGLGYSASQAREAAKHVPEEVETTEEGIRYALKALGAHQRE